MIRNEALKGLRVRFPYDSGAHAVGSTILGTRDGGLANSTATLECFALRLRMFLRFPPMYVSSTSTGPAKLPSSPS